MTKTTTYTCSATGSLEICGPVKEQGSMCRACKRLQNRPRPLSQTPGEFSAIVNSVAHLRRVW